MFGRNKLYPGMGLRFAYYKSLRPLQFIFEVFDLQGDGEAHIVFGFLYRSVKLTMSFPGAKYKWRYSLHLFGKEGQLWYRPGECGSLWDDVKTFFGKK